MYIAMITQVSHNLWQRNLVSINIRHCSIPPKIMQYLTIFEKLSTKMEPHSQ
jgi:hypothetical protein